jgi:predicted PP-loop superfamily ATPase
MEEKIVNFDNVVISVNVLKYLFQNGYDGLLAGKSSSCGLGSCFSLVSQSLLGLVRRLSTNQVLFLDGSLSLGSCALGNTGR